MVLCNLPAESVGAGALKRTPKFAIPDFAEQWLVPAG